MDQHQQEAPGGAVAVVALVSRGNILLIKEPSKPAPHFWKLISEKVEPGESVEHAAISGLKEEAGFPNLAVEYDPQGRAVRINDPRITHFAEVGEPELICSRFPHYRHFFIAVTSDAVIRSLSDQVLNPEEDEVIETQSFPQGSLAMLSQEHKLLRQQAELILSVPHHLKALAA